MSEMLSPAVYLRCSENSTEKPWNGLAWSPAMNPSTMNLARRSSRATWRITSGFRYFSAVLATHPPYLSSPSRLVVQDLSQRYSQPWQKVKRVILGTLQVVLEDASGRGLDDG